MFNVELYNRTARKVMFSRRASTEAEAAEVVRRFISCAKSAGTVIHESGLDISPRGYAIGQTIQTENAVYDITTARM